MTVHHRALGILRMLVVTWWLHCKIMAVSTFNSVFQVLWPLFFATSAFLVYRTSGAGDVLLHTALGASMMGVWSTVATTSSDTLQRERMLGTLELLVSSPTPFALTMVPLTVAMATLGLYSMAATLFWAWLVFGVPLHITSPFAFAVSVVCALLSMAMIGFVLSMSAVRYRTAWALGNMLEYPGWLLCGFLVPVTMFPGWVAGISYALPPTWGAQAVRQAAAGVAPWTSVAVCVALGAGYAVLAALLADTVLRSARRKATLQLT